MFGAILIGSPGWSARLGDLAGLDLPAAGGVNRAQHPTVVGHQDQRPGVTSKSFFQLFDRGQVEVVRRLVQDQQIDPASL